MEVTSSHETMCVCTGDHLIYVCTVYGGISGATIGMELLSVVVYKVRYYCLTVSSHQQEVQLARVMMEI